MHANTRAKKKSNEAVSQGLRHNYSLDGLQCQTVKPESAFFGNVVCDVNLWTHDWKCHQHHTDLHL